MLAIDDPSEVGFTTANVSGSVARATDPSPASDAACHFEYVTNAQFLGSGFKNANQVACDPNPIVVPGTNLVAGAITGLKPGVTYRVRLTASNGAGSSSLVAANSFATTAIAPPSATIAAPTAVTATSANFSGSVDPELGPGEPSLYEVDWHFQCSPECTDSEGNLPSGSPVPPGNSPHPVEADAVLEPNTTYRVSLVAANAGESVTAGPLFFSTDVLPPLARTLGAAVQSTSAQLGAKINPLNSPVTYQFQWGVKQGENDESYENVVPAAPQQLPVADNTFHVVAETITGLQPQVTYHYRIVAVNTETGDESFGVDRSFTTLPVPTPPPPCANQSSRVGPSASLPDCRVYEFVTPGLNNSAPASGWPSISVQGILADGSAVAFSAGDPPENAEGATSTGDTFVAAHGASGWSTKSLSAPTPQSTGTDFGDSRSTVGLSSDFSQSVLWTNQPLVGGSSPAGTNLYLRRANDSFQALTKNGAPQYGPGGELSGASQDFTRLFVVSTVKQLDEDPVNGGNTYEWANGTLRLVTILPGSPEEPAPEGGAVPSGPLPSVSEDGTRVLFKAVGLPGLYLRKNAGQTVEVSASQRNVEPDPNPPADAVAAGMSADGSEVLFTSASELTNDANTGRTGGVANDRGSDLYSFDVASGVLTDLTVDEDPADAATGANVERVLGADRDASYIYFVARGNLAPGGTSGERNLYVEHEGEIRFVGSDPVGGPEGSFYVTPDGQHAAFVTTEPQTGYDNAGRSEVYKYTFGGQLECASCRQGGELPTGDASIVGRAISDNGDRLFFQSTDSVVPQAQNGQSNVFEYIAGEVRLLTPGDGGAALLVGADASGDDVFIAAFEDLAPQGQGDVFGIYDARVGANVSSSTTSAGCQGESCRSGAPPAPSEVSPGTASFEAPGKVALSAPKFIKGAKASLRVIAPGAGELTVSGRGLGTITKPASKAGAVTIPVTLKRGAQTKLEKNRVYRTEVEVLYKSGAGESSRAAASLKFEAARKKSKGAK